MVLVSDEMLTSNTYCLFALKMLDRLKKNFIRETGKYIKYKDQTLDNC